ncbi:helicase HerA domain-containing protein [Leptolyngbya sp. KIOST-1]|uniref:helicase HerA domain-containing protein n=1 Tax=Leptolyngbya sp. KIOST-1 TaxID=1229172 RepID=UPI0018CCD77F|nr:DUF87 domain-containing protein [Leptolyngbya sp. KIOST-1]
MASIEEGFALFDYVRIDQGEMAWIGQILEPNRNISIVNSSRLDPTILHGLRLMQEHPEVQSVESVQVFEIGILGQYDGRQLLTPRLRPLPGAVVSRLNIEDTSRVIGIPQRFDREDGSSNVVGELLNAAGVPLCIDALKFNYHIMVSGGTGSGKSNVSANLVEQALFGISSTAYLRYFEVRHGLELEEPYIFFDGTLVYEWLVATQEGVDLYESLFASGKQCIGVMKNIKANVVFSTFARALRTGELFIIETLYDHFSNSNAPNRNQGESSRGTLSSFLNGAATRVLRGIFKPRNKVFGFEVHEDHLENMLRIMTADCQMNHAGHEIPFLLNRVDEEVRRNFNSRILQDRIALRMATQSEELFFEEMNERTFR